MGKLIRLARPAIPGRLSLTGFYGIYMVADQKFPATALEKGLSFDYGFPGFAGSRARCPGPQVLMQIVIWLNLKWRL
jgi:hypothetical protein